MWIIRQEQLASLDEDAKDRMVDSWASGNSPMSDPKWDRAALAEQTLVLARQYEIDGPEEQIKLHEIILRYGPTFPGGHRFRRHRMILDSSDFSSPYRIEQLQLLMAAPEG